MLYRISVAERDLTGIVNIFRSRLSGRPFTSWDCPFNNSVLSVFQIFYLQ